MEWCKIITAPQSFLACACAHAHAYMLHEQRGKQIVLFETLKLRQDPKKKKPKK